MTVYSMAELEINDMEAMQPYLEKVAATIAAHGGKYLVAGGEPEVIEGGLGQCPIKVLVRRVPGPHSAPAAELQLQHLHVEGRFALSAA
jgi:hypothetical protein